MPRPIKNEKGARYGRLVVLAKAKHNEKQHCAMWRCRCDCGRVVVTRGSSLRNGHAQSCGCLQVEAAAAGAAAANRVIRDPKDLARRYKAGETREQLAMAFGVTPLHVDKTVRSLGVKTRNKKMRVRPGSRQLSQKDRAIAVRMYAQGHSGMSIGRRLDVTPEAVYRLLKSLGVERRHCGRRHIGRRRKDNNGYTVVSMKRSDPLYHSMASSNGCCVEHRLVMARHLGRPLMAGETVHHINGKRQDNRLENLQLRQGAHGRGAHLRCLDCGSQRVEPVAI